MKTKQKKRTTTKTTTPRAAAAPATRTPCLIAVGGAKGGVGKSVLAANLGVALAARGHETVVVDLDLGGANQHLYLGHRALLPSTMNDFLFGRARTLSEVAVDTRFGPRLIGGNSSELGAANLSFAKKMKMLRALRSLDADYVILDLGGDTSYNIVDCFNAADLSVVVTTRESASYIGAYQFIKVALYRKLQRAFGPESRFAGRKEELLEGIIAQATSMEGSSGRGIADLLAEVSLDAPESVGLLREILDDFRPLLVTNRLPARFDATQLVRNLQSVTMRWLSKEVVHLGSLSAHEDVEASAIELIPVIERHPDGQTAGELNAIVLRLLAEERRATKANVPPLPMLSAAEESEEALSVVPSAELIERQAGEPGPAGDATDDATDEATDDAFVAPPAVDDALEEEKLAAARALAAKWALAEAAANDVGADALLESHAAAPAAAMDAMPDVAPVAEPPTLATPALVAVFSEPLDMSKPPRPSRGAGLGLAQARAGMRPG